jgi:hypothetical protein
VLIGILSDSHGRSETVRKAVQLFDRLGASALIHCGDVGGMSVFDELAGHECHFVWGNMDFPEEGLLSYIRTLGIPLPMSIPLRLELAGKSFAVFHGHEREFETDLRRLTVDYILHGHTHERRDERLGPTRIINPGALHRARPKTAATLDTETDELTFHEIG